MNLFRVGDRGVRRDGQPYEVVALRGEKVCFYNPLKLSPDQYISANGKGHFRVGQTSSRDLMLPDDAIVHGGWYGIGFRMDHLRQHGWTDDQLHASYPLLKRQDKPMKDEDYSYSNPIDLLADRVTQTEERIATTRHKGYYMKVAEGHVGRIEIGSMKIFFTGEINIEEKL